MKHFASNERRHFKQIVASNIQKSHRPPLVSSKTSHDLNKQQKTRANMFEAISTSSELSNSQILSSMSTLDFKPMKPIVEASHSSIDHTIKPVFNKTISVESKLLKYVYIS